MATVIVYDPLRLHLPPNVTSAMARGGVGQHVFEARKDLQGPAGHNHCVESTPDDDRRHPPGGPEGEGDTRVDAAADHTYAEHGRSVRPGLLDDGDL